MTSNRLANQFKQDPVALDRAYLGFCWFSRSSAWCMFRYRFVEGSPGEAGARLSRVSIPVLGLLGAMFFPTPKGWRVRLASPNTLCSAMSTRILLSVQWSNNPSLAFGRLIHFVSDVRGGIWGMDIPLSRGTYLLSVSCSSAGIQITVGFLF